MPTPDATSEGLLTVRILGLPVALHQRAAEHRDELLRELALISAGEAGSDLDPRTVPARLVVLVEELRAWFSGYTLQTESELADAAARGLDTVHLEYRVPASAGQAAAELDALLAEADEICRSGDLLTLTTPPEVVAFRQWFLGEFVRQAAGLPPTPWSEREPLAG